MESLEKNEISWITGDLSSQATSVPEIIAEESKNNVGTLVIFVISAVLAITALFVIAIFIDCRQEKLIKLEESKRKFKIKLPNVIRQRRDDEVTFSDKMVTQESHPSTSNIV